MVGNEGHKAHLTSRHGVASIDPQIGSSDVSASIACKKCDRAHEIFWTTHPALRDERGPLLLKLGIVVKNLLSSGDTINIGKLRYGITGFEDDLQGGQHVAGTDTVHPNPGVCPFYRKTGRKVPHGCFSSIVWGLRLRDVDNAPRHTSNEN